MDLNRQPITYSVGIGGQGYSSLWITCETCTQAKGEYQQPVGKLHPLPLATKPLESIEMDFVGPFPEVDGFNCLWVIICRMSSMVHLVLVNMTTTASQLSVITDMKSYACMDYCWSCPVSLEHTKSTERSRVCYQTQAIRDADKQRWDSFLCTRMSIY